MNGMRCFWSGVALAACAAGPALAADGVWTNTAGGDWADGANWLDGVVAEGAGYSAAFTVAVPSEAVVALPAGAGAIGTVQGGALFTLSKTGSGVFSLKSAPDFLGLWQLGGGTLELLAEEAQPAILANVAMSGQTVVAVPTAGASAVISNLTGSAELIKSGDGTLSLEKTDGASVITLDQGALVLSSQIPPSQPVEGAWFRVDATVSSSLVLRPVNGTNFVETWGDARWQSAQPDAFNIYSTNDDPATRPFVRTNYLNGLPVVDFGSFWWPDPNIKEYGYGGKLTWNESSSIVYEGFLVFSDTEDRANAEYSCDFLGNLDAMAGHFNRGVGHTLLNPTYANANLLADGVWAVDGKAVTCAHVLTPGFHVISFASAVPVVASTFARIGDLYAGGQRLAEVLVYTNVLTAAQRRQNTDYLGYKWFARTAASVETLTVKNNTTLSITDGDVGIGTLAIEGTAVKNGGSDLIVDTLTGEALVVNEGHVVLKSGAALLGALTFTNANPDVAVTEASGSMALDRIEAKGTLTKTGGGAVTIGSLDAEVSSLVVEGGSLIVSNSWTYFKNYRDPWFHVDATVPSSFGLNSINGTNFVSVWGDTRYKDDTSTFTVYSYNWNTSTQPFLRPNYLNGLPVVDFGSFWWPDPAVQEYGYGGWLQWNVACITVYEGFIVFSDTDDRVGARCYSDVLGNLSGGAGYFNRGEYAKLLFDPWANANLLTAPWTIDGLSVLSSATLTPGFHVISFASTVPVTAAAFARIGSDVVYSGGQRLGEVLIYTNTLSEASRQSIREYLTAKWMAGGTGTRPLDRLDVAAGGLVAVPAGRLAVGTLTGAGTVTALGVTAAGTVSAGDADGAVATLTVNGGLALTNGVLVKVDYAPPACDLVKVNGPLTLLGAGTFEVDCDAGGLIGQAPVVMEFTAIEGDEYLSQWTVTGTVRSRYSVKPVLVGNTIQLTFSAHGLILQLQ